MSSVLAPSIPRTDGLVIQIYIKNYAGMFNGAPWVNPCGIIEIGKLGKIETQPGGNCKK
ncbi:MAG: hypothetical protein K9M19_05205 [Candidatus Marinimicrobia bacterium]|nr:hypothetical protein [Candidatus Neomarinimicrobiota bacterium]